VGRLVDDLAEVEDELRVTQMAIDRAKEELSSARRRHARVIAAELGPEYDAVATRIAIALEDLTRAQADERALHVRVRQASGVEQVLPELGRALPGADALLMRAREYFAAKGRAAA
jgi:hypothetical protein